MPPRTPACPTASSAASRARSRTRSSTRPAARDRRSTSLSSSFSRASKALRLFGSSALRGALEKKLSKRKCEVPASLRGTLLLSVLRRLRPLVRAQLTARVSEGTERDERRPPSAQRIVRRTQTRTPKTQNYVDSTSENFVAFTRQSLRTKP